MRRPLHKGLAHAPLELCKGNAGLWYDKFCDHWDDRSWTLSGDDGGKLAWIETVTKQRVGDEVLMDESLSRVIRLTIARSGVFGLFETECRFVTGLGRGHPVENGFTWHPTLGVPYLPGSSIKGLVRAWAECDAEPRWSNEQVNAVLGSPGAAGQVVFLDALPVAPVTLEADVMTPHFAGWGHDDPPGDWRRPIPVPFLVTGPQTAFVFSIIPLRSTSALTVTSVFEWLCAALTFAGAGAKTSVGYGRFRLNTQATDARRQALEVEHRANADARRRSEAARTSQGRWGLEIEGKAERDVLELVRLHLEKEPLPDIAELRGLARAVVATGLPELWRKGKRRDPSTQVGEKKLRERAKAVLAAASTE